MNKQELLNKKRLLLAALTLSTGLALTGCDKTYKLNNSTIKYVYDKTYESDSFDGIFVEGNIKYNDLDSIQTWTYEKNNNICSRLVFCVAKKALDNTIDIKFYDLEEGVLFYEIKKEISKSSNEKILVGEDIRIIDIQSIANYLLENENIKQEYTINEIRDVYTKRVEPILDQKYKVK